MNTIYKVLTVAVIITVMAACKSDNVVPADSPIEANEAGLISVSQKQFDASQMMEGKLEKKNFKKSIRANGQIEIANRSKAVVSSLLGGTAGAINLTIGQWVKKGETLLRISNPELIDLQEQYLVLQSKATYLREEQERLKELVKENLIPKQELLLAQADYQTNRSMFKTVSQKLKLYGVDISALTADNLSSSIRIQSPISGYVTNIGAMQGQFVDPTTELLTITNTAMAYLSLQVLERDGRLIKKGQVISFTVQSDETNKYQATVYLINPSIDESGMLKVHCKLEKSTNLRPGTYVTADLIVDNYEGNAVPEEAIVQIEGKSHIMIRAGKSNNEIKFEPLAVEVGQSEDGYVEIKNSMELKDENILIKGGYYLTN